MVGRSAALAPLLLVMAALQVHPEDKEVEPRRRFNPFFPMRFRSPSPPACCRRTKSLSGTRRAQRSPFRGRSIRVRLDGDNVRIFLVCTPYLQDSGAVVLLAQGQVWFSTPAEKELTYSSTFSSIPVSYGEKVLFFPLGLTDSRAREKGLENVEVEIRVVPFGDTAGKPKAEPVPPAAKPETLQPQPAPEGTPRE